MMQWMGIKRANKGLRPKEGTEENSGYPAIMVNIDPLCYFAPIPLLYHPTSVPMNSARIRPFQSPFPSTKKQQQQQLLLFLSV